jgi:hypothetical protein
MSSARRARGLSLSKAVEARTLEPLNPEPMNLKNGIDPNTRKNVWKSRLKAIPDTAAKRHPDTF